MNKQEAIKWICDNTEENIENIIFYAKKGKDTYSFYIGIVTLLGTVDLQCISEHIHAVIDYYRIVQVGGTTAIHAQPSRNPYGIVHDVFILIGRPFIVKEL